MKSFSLFLILLLLALPAAAQQPTIPLADWLAANGGQPCPDDSAFTCVTLTVPRDHAEPDDGQTLAVQFAVLPAAVESQGLFVVVVGGPGGAGVASADSYISPLTSEWTDYLDIVFFDQRGIGGSGGLDCPEAYVAYSLSDAQPGTPEGDAAFIDAARTFAESCVAEMGSPDSLPYLGTEQAIHDLKAFWDVVGAPPLWLYGESYGTQFAQEYAAAYPDSITGLLLDGVVDLTLTGEEFYVGQTQAFSDALAATLDACTADPVCAADAGGDAAVLYDELAAELATAPVTVLFPLPNGTDGAGEPRQFTLAMLEGVAASAVYGRDDRAFFLRNLAAASRGDLLPLLRLAYQTLGLDPLTQEVIADPSYSNGMYYGVECNDYRFGADTPQANAEAFLRAGAAVAAQVPRLSGIYYTDLPCVFWPVAGREERPAPLTGLPFTTFILNSDIDPATPVSNGLAVFDRLTSDAYMITQQGGPHVIWGRGDTCPDAALVAWMLDGAAPAEREQVCPGAVLGAYTPLSPASAADLAEAIDFAGALETEIVSLPEYVYWDGYETLTIGCAGGGALTLSGTDDSETYTFDSCGLFGGAVIEGEGVYVYGDAYTFTVQVSGAVQGDFVYRYDEAVGAYSLRGTYNSAVIDLRP